ncbi:MAG: hypothetical protein P4M11_10685 [Candidatus Pacebacteria bacterium]|nr:hypothetical protein [Candidatus Paceibacterota bacterium]
MVAICADEEIDLPEELVEILSALPFANVSSAVKVEVLALLDFAAHAVHPNKIDLIDFGTRVLQAHPKDEPIFRAGIHVVGKVFSLFRVEDAEKVHNPGRIPAV